MHRFVQALQHALFVPGRESPSGANCGRRYRCRTTLPPFPRRQCAGSSVAAKTVAGSGT
jgi:hypothetical protein